MTNSTSRIMGEPVLFSDQHLHGSLFSPDGDVAVAVLLAPPLFEEKRCAHRALICCARALAQAGALVMLPDLYGTGNSRGSLTEIGIDRWMDDLQAARDFLRDRAGSIPLTVLGCRAGALLVAHAIAGGWPVHKFVLWQPVADGRGYLNQLRTRRMIQDKMTGDESPITGQYEVEGHDLSQALYEGFQALRMPAEMPRIDLRLLQCSFNDKLLTEHTRLVAQWGEDRVQVRNIICEPFWHPHSPGEYAELAQAVVAEVLA